MRSLTPRFSLLMTTDAVGGVWRYALDACGALSARGAEAVLVGLGPRPAPAQAEEAAAAGVPLLWLDEPLDWAVEGPEALARTGEALARLVRDGLPDVLHLNNPALMPFVEPGSHRVTAAHSCIATWWRGTKDEPVPPERAWHQAATAEGLAAADTALAPTHSYARMLRATYGALPHLQVVHNAVRPVEPQPKGRFVLAAGRWWDESKNLRSLDIAAAQSPLPVRVAGPLDGAGCQGPRPDSAEWLGELAHRDLRSHMARAPIFVSLSLYEPFGLAVLEAATAGAALVLSDIPTFRELWEGCALFVDPRRPDAVAAALRHLHDDPGAVRLLGAEARQRALGFSTERQADALLAAYGRTPALAMAM